MRKAWLLGMGWLAAACSSNTGTTPGQPAPRSRYFALNSFLEEQAKQLNQRQPGVTKQVRLRTGGQETTQVKQLDWRKELQIFQQADITKPALRGAYTVDSTVENGILRRRYQRRPGIEHPVRQLTVLSNGPQVVAVEAVITQDNPLVYSNKTVELHCQNGQVASYRVNGVQKLVLFDSVRYAVSSRVQ
ncbi:hypothetical protein FY528_10700 [Hymenobacter lutimineralis]|uniref:Uncharacterized protein n=1 Tax=Hymenobacter lutimineralis TaxID=2606448 RepID=A0A5D6V314_9BACT|nr:hypothetical protein [Hymenobacter lutimineralis]TYZ09209.1 hypothetical protein FY528_10700 [Hymenobacter lutimineralis]